MVEEQLLGLEEEQQPEREQPEWVVERPCCKLLYLYEDRSEKLLMFEFGRLLG